jgi:hypothetical protein
MCSLKSTAIEVCVKFPTWASVIPSLGGLHTFSYGLTGHAIAGKNLVAQL